MYVHVIQIRRDEWAYHFFRSIVFPACCVCLRRLAAPRLESVHILTIDQLLGTE